MRCRILAIASLSMAVAVAASGQTAGNEPIVQIGIFGYQADGSDTSAAYDTEPSLDSMVYASGSLCRQGAGLRAAPAWAAYAWRFSGRVVSKSPDEAVVQVTWQRTMDNGNPGTASESSVQLTLRASDRVALDAVYQLGNSTCAANVAFEARYMPRRSVGVRGGVKSGVADGVATGAGGGSGGTGSSAGVSAGPTARGASGAGAGGFSAGRMSGLSRWMDVNLWLVRTAPGRREEAIHQVVRAPQEGADFAFAPISIETPRGPIVVQVRGSFSVTDDHKLIFVTNRSVRYAAQSSRDNAERVGNARIVSRMPGPDDVLSFDMPAIPGLGGEPSPPDQLSVRVKITPR